MALHMLGVLFLWLIRVAIARSRGVNEREGGNDGLVETKACSAILKKMVHIRDERGPRGFFLRQCWASRKAHTSLEDTD